MDESEYGSLSWGGKRFMVRMKVEDVERLELLLTDFGGMLWVASFLLADVLDMLEDLRPDLSTLLTWLRKTCREGKLCMIDDTEISLQARVTLGAGVEVSMRLPPKGGLTPVSATDMQKFNSEIAFALLEKVNPPPANVEPCPVTMSARIGQQSDPGGGSTPPQKRSRVDDGASGNETLASDTAGGAPGSSPTANIGQVKVVSGRRGGRGRGRGRGRTGGKGAMKIGRGK
ncbi:hypothetical protein BSKO_07148 [Bryopsis sp. KO-2023]|nr:hypothetical protein BSKO_07148 [Bryopsis sp. KO-2023]